MSQRDHFTATDVAQAITAGLGDGCYLAQVRGYPGLPVLGYATADAAPTDPEDYFQASGGSAFAFSKGPDIPPTWVIVQYGPDPGATVEIAIARTDADS